MLLFSVPAFGAYSNNTPFMATGGTFKILDSSGAYMNTDPVDGTVTIPAGSYIDEYFSGRTNLLTCFSWMVNSSAVGSSAIRYKWNYNNAGWGGDATFNFSTTPGTWQNSSWYPFNNSSPAYAFFFGANDNNSSVVWRITNISASPVKINFWFKTGTVGPIYPADGTTTLITTNGGIPDETWDYKAYLGVTRKNSANPFLTNSIIYNVYFEIQKKVANSTDSADMTPITGKLYFDGANKLYTYWGYNTPLSVVQNHDPQLPSSIASTVPDHYKGDYSSGNLYGQLFSNPATVDFRFVPDDVRYKPLYGSFDSSLIKSEQYLQHQEYNTGTGSNDYGSKDPGTGAVTPAVPNNNQSAQTPPSDMQANSLAGRSNTIKTALAAKAPFAWWSQISTNVNTSGSDASDWGIYWTVDTAGHQVGWTITSVSTSAVRDLSTLMLTALGLWVGYGEIRRLFG